MFTGLLRNNINTVQKNTEAFVDANTEVGQEVKVKISL
jgi:hypothetical protein